MRGRLREFGDMSSADGLVQTVRSSLAESGRDAFDEVLEKILRHFDCVTGTVHLLGEDGMLDLLAQRGIPDSILDKVAKIPVGKGMAGLAAERMEPVQVCNLQTDDSGDVRPGAKDTRMEGSIAAPIVAGSGELVGTLGVAKPVAYDFSDDEAALIAELGRVIAEFV